MVYEDNKVKDRHPMLNKVLTVLGIVLCIILIPILLTNISLIVQSYTNTEEVPKLNGYSPLIVLTGSMEPAIESGDLIIVQQVDSSQVSVGDIIAFFDPESTDSSVVTHRVTEVLSEGGTLSFRTKGDLNNVEDTLSVPSSNLVGVYRTKLHGVGNIAMFMQTTTGLVVCVIVPLVLLVAVDIIRHRQFERQNQQDTAKLLAELEQLKAEKSNLDGKQS
jgi:signal peptidase